MRDVKEISEILIKKGKVRGKPVAVSLFRDSIPAEYESIMEEPCTIIHHAMDEGKRVYFDAEHHDCLVGVYHSGMAPGKNDIVSGEYLSKTSSFFSYEGAARLKSGTVNLPPGMVKAIGAAPLDDVPEGVDVDWVVVVCTPHFVNMIAGCRLVEDGVLPRGAFGTSLCGELFSMPWHEQNVIVTSGDFGGRTNNRIKKDELFVVIPIQYVQNIPRTLVDIKLDVKANLSATKPPHSKFWKKTEETTKKFTDVAKDEEAAVLTFSMDWDDESMEIVKMAPEGIIEFAVESVEEFAKKKGYEKITKKIIAEQMEDVGMSLDDVFG